MKGAQSDTVLEAFLRGAEERGDLVAMALPSDERLAFDRRLSSRGIDVADRLARNDWIMASAETYDPREGGDEESVSSFLDALMRQVRTQGKAGLSFIGRIAPRLFEEGDLPTAEMMERAFHRQRGPARFFCPYDATELSLDRIQQARSLLASHTHTITPLRPNRFLLERVGGDPAE